MVIRWLTAVACNTKLDKNVAQPPCQVSQSSTRLSHFTAKNRAKIAIMKNPFSIMMSDIGLVPDERRFIDMPIKAKQAKVIRELYEYDHAFLSPEGAAHFTEPFGFEARVHFEKVDYPHNPKGLRLNDEPRKITYKSVYQNLLPAARRFCAVRKPALPLVAKLAEQNTLSDYRD